MSKNPDEKAAAIVREMSGLGARFSISDMGPAGELRWHWEPVPELKRNVIRRRWAAVENRNEPGFASAMVDAIRRHNDGGAGVR